MKGPARAAAGGSRSMVTYSAGESGWWWRASRIAITQMSKAAVVHPSPV